VLAAPEVALELAAIASPEASGRSLVSRASSSDSTYAAMSGVLARQLVDPALPGPDASTSSPTGSGTPSTSSSRPSSASVALGHGVCDT
jgi:hypothetical protein